MSSNYMTAFVGALQASVSVLLTISYGVIAAQWGLLDQASGKKVSTLCVKMFLPALLFINIGGQISIDALPRYAPIVVYSLCYNGISILAGLILVKIFKLPSWGTPAITFNNVISFPLLLTQALQSTGALDSILWGSSDSPSDAVTRAKSYFLVNAMIADSLTFGIGHKLLGGASNEDAPDNKDSSKDDQQSEETVVVDQDSQDFEEQARATEETSLLPNKAVRFDVTIQRKVSHFGMTIWERLPSFLRTVLAEAWGFVSPPLVGAMLGVIVGLVPVFQTAFFSDTYEGGYLNAWFTKSIENVGELFTALQVVVVGVKLRAALYNMKKGEDSGPLPWKPLIIIIIVRFIIWPAISITTIYLLAKRTSILSNDPILWFAMMLMPVGPPALKLTALADVTGSDDKEKMSIAKFLTFSYIISPILTFPVVAAITATQNAVGAS